MSATLTAAFVKAVKPDASKRLEIPDRGTGLYLIVQPKGTKSWALRYRHAGKAVKLTLGPALILEGAEREPEGEPQIGRPLTLKGARALAGSLQRQVARGDHPAAQKKLAKAGKAKPQDLFEDAAKEFIERYAKGANRRSSWLETARLLGFKPDPADMSQLVRRPAKKGTFAGVVHHWAGRRLQDIRRRDVIDLLTVVADGGAPFSANRAFAAIRRFFNWCVERDLITLSPCVGVKAPTKEVSRDRVLSDEELGLVWRAAAGLSEPYGAFIRLLILTGQRRDEVADMTWSEVDPAGKNWVLPRERAKNNSTHEVPLSVQSVAVLMTVRRIDGLPAYVFTTGSTRTRDVGDKMRLTPISGFSKAKRKLDEAVETIRQKEATEAGVDLSTLSPIEPWRLHDLRRTMASGMARLSIGLPVIEKVLNHQSGTFRGVVGVYQRHSFADEKRAALQLWANHVDGVLRGGVGNVIPLKGRGR